MRSFALAAISTAVIDVRIGPLEGADGTLDDRIERGRAGVATRNEPIFPTCRPSCRVNSAFRLWRNGPHMLQERPAGIRQLRALRDAMEQGGADLAFQVPDLLTERRPANAHARRGPGEVPLLRYGEEISDVTQFHR